MDSSSSVDSSHLCLVFQHAQPLPTSFGSVKYQRTKRRTSEDKPDCGGNRLDQVESDRVTLRALVKMKIHSPTAWCVCYCSARPPLCIFITAQRQKENVEGGECGGHCASTLSLEVNTDRFNVLDITWQWPPQQRATGAYVSLSMVCPSLVPVCSADCVGVDTMQRATFCEMKTMLGNLDSTTRIYWCSIFAQAPELQLVCRHEIIILALLL